MKGNQGRRGAMAKTPKTGPTVGSGGKRKRGLAGKGPTPKAEDRVYHQAYARKKRREYLQAQEVERERIREKARQRSRVRVSEGNELVVGRNAVIEACRSGRRVLRAFVDPAHQESIKMRETIEALAKTGAPFVEVTKRDLTLSAEGTAHQGVAIEIEGYDYWELEDLLIRAQEKLEPGLLVALDHVTDPHNVGAVLRSAAAFRADGLILPERRSAGVNIAAWKVSAGTAAHVPTTRVTNLVRALQSCKEQGMFVVGLDGGGDTNLRDLALADRSLVIVTGAEGTGLSRLVRSTCDQIVSIPLGERAESLNAAVATGIALYEVDSLRRAKTTIL